MGTLFYRLLSIDSRSNKMLLLFLPPVKCLWLFGITTAAGKRLKRSTPVTDLLVMIDALQVSMALLFSLFPATRFLIQHSAPGIAFVVSTALFRLLIVPVMLAYLTTQADRMKRPDHFFTLSDSKDYVWRFFGFVYLPLTIWSMQATLAADLKEELTGKMFPD